MGSESATREVDDDDEKTQSMADHSCSKTKILTETEQQPATSMRHICNVGLADVVVV